MRGAHALADLAHHDGHAGKAAIRIFDGGNRERDIDALAAFPDADRFVSAGCACSRRHDRAAGLFKAVRRHKHGSMFSDDLRGCVPKQRLGAVVPTDDCSIRRYAIDRIVRGLHDRRQHGRSLFGLLPFGDVPLDGQVADDLAGGAVHRREAHLFAIERAILAPIDDFSVPDLAGSDGMPQVFVVFSRLESRFDDAWVLSDGFLSTVSGHRGKRRIHIIDLAGGIGDYDGIRGLLHGRDQPGMGDLGFLESGAGGVCANGFGRIAIASLLMHPNHL